MKCDEQGNIWVWPGRSGSSLRTASTSEQVGSPEHTGNLNWGGEDWNVLYVPSSTSVYRFPTKVRGNPVAYVR